MSGDQLIKVTFGALQTAQGDIASTSSSINTQLDDLRKFVTQLTSTWTGAAAEAYQGLQKQWDQSAADLNQVLASIGTAVGQANESYQQAENANRGRWA
jgi:early secretory antigenic target protein ESAT-6